MAQSDESGFQTRGPMGLVASKPPTGHNYLRTAFAQLSQEYSIGGVRVIFEDFFSQIVTSAISCALNRYANQQREHSLLRKSTGEFNPQCNMFLCSQGCIFSNDINDNSHAW